MDTFWRLIFSRSSGFRTRGEEMSPLTVSVCGGLSWPNARRAEARATGINRKLVRCMILIQEAILQRLYCSRCKTVFIIRDIGPDMQEGPVYLELEDVGIGRRKVVRPA